MCQLSLVHQDHIYCVSQVPNNKHSIFISGDGKDKCFVWRIQKKEGEDGHMECIKIAELEGHTETVEIIKFNHDGKMMLTGGMNNVLRVWQLTNEESENPVFTLKTKLENGPSEKEDILVAEWHPKGNAVLCGGKDYTLYLLNGSTGDFLACFTGHEDEVL
jgi:WD40 repeat protein